LSKLTNKLEGINAVFLDLDGTIYLGNDLIPGALDFLARCEENGIKRFFLSNNSSRSVKQYVSKLQNLGIPATDDEILLSTHDLVAWLNRFDYNRICLVGTEGMQEMLVSEGLEIDDIDPEIVVLGYDTEINYSKLSTASKHLHRGIPLVASHPDIVCPSPNGGLPDVGAYLAMFKATTGVEPIHITGKPNPGMILHKIEEMGLNPMHCAMVGDRLYTDIAMAKNAGCVGVLVLSGETTLDDLNNENEGPDIIVDSVASLLI